MPAYRGRFAPSPSGPLHFGSLIAALGSWIDARHHEGEWLVRIEDIDPPREIEGAADHILNTLEKYGLYWDRSVFYQSSQLINYQQIVDAFQKEDIVYPCTCTRKKIRLTGGIYNNHCRELNHCNNELHSIRLKINEPIVHFEDCFQGSCKTNQQNAREDFILKRKDGLFAYMLAVVVDDIQQGITHVIRGADLLETTTQQLYLFKLLAAKPPVYGHLPLAVDHQGQKLSKQNHASAISEDDISKILWQALKFLKQNPEPLLKKESKEILLQWAIEYWDPSLFHGNLQNLYADEK